MNNPQIFQEPVPCLITDASQKAFDYCYHHLVDEKGYFYGTEDGFALFHEEKLTPDIYTIPYFTFWKIQMTDIQIISEENINHLTSQLLPEYDNFT